MMFRIAALLSQTSSSYSLWWASFLALFYPSLILIPVYISSCKSAMHLSLPSKEFEFSLGFFEKLFELLYIFPQSYEFFCCFTVLNNFSRRSLFLFAGKRVLSIGTLSRVKHKVKLINRIHSVYFTILYFTLALISKLL